MAGQSILLIYFILMFENTGDISLFTGYLSVNYLLNGVSKTF